MTLNNQFEQDTQVIKVHKKILFGNKVFYFLVLVLVCTGSFFYYLTLAPYANNEPHQLHIEKGMSVKQISEQARGQTIVRSSFLLYSILIVFFDPTAIYAGTYTFDKPYSVFAVAEKLAHKGVDKELKTLTFTEGMTRKEIASVAAKELKNFNKVQFLELTLGKEGYLFPETYFVPPEFSAVQLSALLQQTFNVKFSSVRVASTTLSNMDILTLASLLEREANSEESMRIVSGILQNRLKIKMPLQVDASIEYILDKPLKELTPEDLGIDSLYNTYKHTGLPPSPIGNPGLLAIDAVLHPKISKNLFYITGKNGEFHYASTFAEHQRNIAKYLR